MRRRFRRALLALAVAALAAPGASGAVTFPSLTICVNAPAGTQCDSTQHDLQAALAAAEHTGNPEIIALGRNGVPYNGPFSYPSGEITVENKVTIKGFGSPVLTAPAGSTVLATNNVSVEGVTVSLPSSAEGVGIVAQGGTLRDLRIEGHGPSNSLAGGAKGIVSKGGLTIDGADLVGTGLLGIEATNGTTDASHVRVSDTMAGVGVGETAALDLTHSKISSQRQGVTNIGSATVSSSVLETTAAGESYGAWAAGGPLMLDHDTIVHRGPVDGRDAGVYVTPIDFDSSATLTSVVIAGYSHQVKRDTSGGGLNAPLTIRDSVWDNSHDVFLDAAPASPFTELGNMHVDPKLVDLAGGDLRLRGSSAAVDRDSRTDLRYTDVNGDGLVDGDGNGSELADAGAFEYRRRAPSIDSAQVPDTGAAGQALAFAGAASDPDGDAVKLAWEFGDGAIGAGDQTTHAYAAPGIYTVTLHVTDESGLNATRTFSIAVTAAAVGAAGTTGSSGGSDGGKDLVAPKLTKVRLSKNHRKVLFTVSERAKVRVTVRGRTIVKTVAAGRRSIRLGRVHGVVKLTATDLAGNRSAARRVRS